MKKSYLNAVTPPIFMNSLHVFDTFEEYHDVDVFEKINFIMDVRLIQPPVLQKKGLQNLKHGSRAVMFSSGMAAASAAILAVCEAGKPYYLHEGCFTSR